MAEIVIDNISFTYPESEKPVFAGLSLDLPGGLVSLVGPNGAGKSTLMLLAAARVLPDTGKVLLFGNDTKVLPDEATRQELVSFIYQNLEFETDGPIQDVLEYVYENGFRRIRPYDFLTDLVEAFELECCLDKKLQEVSKGELQRAILAFSFLYGSKIIMMDEPVFSLESYQKERAFEFISDYSRTTGTSIYYSAHELELSEKYSDNAILFSKSGKIELGKTSELLTQKNLEEAYEAPYAHLKQRESLFREYLKG
jgi:iron complex transport system ATP-binding protein